jgi:AcrR family transcriptional regulator
LKLSRKASPALKSADAREILLDTAERLLGEKGIEGASMRQIAAEAGQGNNSVVQYHFGSKAGLMREIIERRVAGFEPRREKLLAATSGDVQSLLKILFLPIAELTDDRGRHAYARFIMQFLSSFRYQAGTEHPGWKPESAASRAAMLLTERLSFLEPADLHQRISHLGGMFFNALIERDNLAASGQPLVPEAVFLDDLFAMMTAAVSAPPPARMAAQRGSGQVRPGPLSPS